MWITMICAYVLTNSQYLSDAYVRLAAATLDSGATPVVVHAHSPGSKADYFDGDKPSWIEVSQLYVGIWPQGFAIRSEVDERNHSTFYLSPVDPAALERVMDELDVLDWHNYCAITGYAPGDSWDTIRWIKGEWHLSFIRCRLSWRYPFTPWAQGCLYVYCTSWRRCEEALLEAAQAETPGAQVEIDTEELRESVWRMLRRYGMAEWERR